MRPCIVCFIAMIPLQKMFDWGGEEISAFLEEDLRDLLVITLSKYVYLDASLDPNTYYSFSQRC